MNCHGLKPKSDPTRIGSIKRYAKLAMYRKGCSSSWIVSFLELNVDLNARMIATATTVVEQSMKDVRRPWELAALTPVVSHEIPHQQRIRKKQG
jgi:hypothetical protein